MLNESKIVQQDVRYRNEQRVRSIGDADPQQQQQSWLKRPIVRILVGLLGFTAALFNLLSVFEILPVWIVDEVYPTKIVGTYTQRADKILKSTPLIDGHNDLAIFIRVLYKNQIYTEKFQQAFEHGPMVGHVDLPRLRQGKNGGAFWSAFTPCPANWSDFSNENYGDSVTATLGQIDLLHRLQAAYPKQFSSNDLTSSTALKSFKKGLLISPIGIEGLHQVGNSYSNLRLYHNLGVRYATLTHNCHNIYADAALTELPGSHDVKVAKPLWNGLSPAGYDMIHEMNRLGMIVDLAHTSQDTMRDVLSGKGSLAPVMFSHSSTYALCPHPRNVPDDVLQLVKMTNSIVMVNFAPDFISCVTNTTDPSGLPIYYPQNSTLEHIASHVMHIGELIGYDHVGFGSDFDGIMSTPKGLEDVSKYPALVAELLRRGVSDKNMRKVVGGNVLRVWGDVENVARKLQKSGRKPAEDKLGDLFMD